MRAGAGGPYRRRIVSPRRTEIAFELHDMVAHGLSAIAVQAEAGLRGDALDADAALATIRAVAHEALDDMRRLLALRGGESPLRPQPSLDQLANVTVEGDPRPVPASLGLAAYRVAEGASGPVVVRWTDDALVLEVAGARATASMRERVRLHGGTLRSGRYGVTATFPGASTRSRNATWSATLRSQTAPA